VGRQHTSILRIIGLSAAASAPRCRDVARHLLPIVEISRGAFSRSGRAKPRLSTPRTDPSARTGETTRMDFADPEISGRSIASRTSQADFSFSFRLMRGGASIYASRRRIYIYMLPSNAPERYNFRGLPSCISVPLRACVEDAHRTSDTSLPRT